MRITNRMMTNNIMYNINNNKINMDTLSQQYASGKKISKPSDDPIVAVRALKLRTNLTELTQYVEKNIPDALNWMDTTEGAIMNMDSILTSMSELCVQGGNDTNTAENRNSIVQDLVQNCKEIYSQGGTNYAGRYVFTGYKTNTNLIFTEDTQNLTYEINDHLSGEDIKIINKLAGEVDLDAFDKNNMDKWDDTMPSVSQKYRLQLFYKDLDTNVTMTQDDFSYTDENGNRFDAYGNMFDKDGNLVDIDGNTYADGDYTIGAGGVVTLTAGGTYTAAGTPISINNVHATDADAYEVTPGEINFIPETGEMILSKEVYEKLRNAKDISVNYTKSSFEKQDLRPEHYFTCTSTNADTGDIIQYEKTDQQMRYELNFNQRISINTQGSDFLTNDLANAITDIVNAVNETKETESKMSEVQKMLTDTSLTDEEREKLNDIYEQLESEFTLKTTLMRETFTSAITTIKDVQETVNIALADLGGRYNRIQLVQSRLEDQKVDFTDLLSSNEDADMVETYINYTTAQTIYNASLQSASMISQSSLLDYIK